MLWADVEEVGRLLFILDSKYLSERKPHFLSSDASRAYLKRAALC